MAAERSAADGRSNFEPSSPTTTLSPGSPSTVSPNCYKDTGAYDCEAATNGSVREKSNCSFCRCNISKLIDLVAKLRSLTGLGKRNQVDDIKSTIVRQREIHPIISIHNGKKLTELD